VAETGQPYAFTGDNPLNESDPLGLSGDVAADTAYNRAHHDDCGLRGERKCHGWGIGKFLKKHWRVIATAGIVIATLPLDEAGVGEEIDADAISADVSADAAEDASDDASDESAGCAGQSFTPSTEVLLANGTTIPIGEVKIGTMVMAANVKTGQVRAERVTHLWIDHDTDLMDVTVRSQGVTFTIDATQHHLFWDVTTGSWTMANALNIGNQLRTPGDSLAYVVGTSVIAGASDMWDLTVGVQHDFFVSTIATPQTGVLVHNCPDRNAKTGSGKEKLPSWYSQGGYGPSPDDVGPSQGATRIMNLQYGEGNWEPGANTEYNQIQKYLARNFYGS
jgi:pretoxin HINT domain-containing protein